MNKIYNNFFKVGLEAIFFAGRIIKKGFYVDKNINYKGEFDPVTEYDKMSEKIIIDKILSKFPNHSIITEEELSYSGDDSIKWIIDPLDGTVNFTHQIPFVSVSIALMIENEIVLGIVYNPIIDELFTSIKNSGAYCNKRRIYVSKTSVIGKSFIATGFPYDRNYRVNELLKPLHDLIKYYQAFRRLGSASIDLAYLARGSFDGYYEENLKPWDTAAGVILVKEAGGVVTDYRGNEYNIFKKNILASNGFIHEYLVELLKEVNII